MTKYEKLYHEIAASIPDCKESKMFGALCIKAPNGKAGVMFKDDDMIFKLTGEKEQEALALKGAHYFDPMGARPMNGWVQIPNSHAAQWSTFASVTMDLVKKIKK